MSSEAWAQLVLAGYGLIAAALVLRQALGTKYSPVAWLLYVIARTHARAYHHWRSDRRCPFPSDGPAIIIANHRSSVDPVYIWTNHHLGSRTHRFRPISFLMAREYYDMPSLNWAFTALRSIPVERDGRDIAALKHALRVLQQGEMVAVFPEGRLNLESHDVLLPGSPGIAWLALRAKVPVFPVFIHNVPRGNTMLAPFLLPTRMRLIYGDAIDLSAYDGCKPTHALLQEVTAVLMRQLAELGGIECSESAEDEEQPSIPIRPAVG